MHEDGKSLNNITFFVLYTYQGLDTTYTPAPAQAATQSCAPCHNSHFPSFNTSSTIPQATITMTNKTTETTRKQQLANSPQSSELVYVCAGEPNLLEPASSHAM